MTTQPPDHPWNRPRPAVPAWKPPVMREAREHRPATRKGIAELDGLGSLADLGALPGERGGKL